MIFDNNDNIEFVNDLFVQDYGSSVIGLMKRQASKEGEKFR